MKKEKEGEEKWKRRGFSSILGPPRRPSRQDSNASMYDLVIRSALFNWGYDLCKKCIQIGTLSEKMLGIRFLSVEMRIVQKKWSVYQNVISVSRYYKAEWPIV